MSAATSLVTTPNKEVGANPPAPPPSMIVRAISLGCSRWRPANVIAIGASASDVNDEPIASSSTASRKYDDNGVSGVTVSQHGVTREEHADAVILSSGGFQVNTEWRTRYLGPNWDLAKVRGTRTTPATATRWRSTPAPPPAHWSGCHAVGWDRNAPEVRRSRGR